MATRSKATVLGPGILKFGETGENDWSCQVTSIEVSMDPDRDDPIPTLCGGHLVGDAQYTATLEATFAQDLEETGIIAWSWKNKNTTQKCVFVPAKNGATKIEGDVVIDPLTVGGDVGKRNTSDAKWAFVGESEMTFDYVAED